MPTDNVRQVEKNLLWCAELSDLTTDALAYREYQAMVYCGRCGAAGFVQIYY